MRYGIDCKLRNMAKTILFGYKLNWELRVFYLDYGIGVLRVVRIGGRAFWSLG